MTRRSAQPSTVPDEARAAAESFYAGDLEAALRLAQTAIAKSPCAEAFAIAASVHEAQSAHRRALLAYRHGLALFPDNPLLTVNFARFLRAMPARVPEAVALLTAFVRRVPDFAPARLSLIETLRGPANDLETAAEEARRYVARYPKDADGHLALALTLFNRFELNAALAAADKALTLGGKIARVWELKANIFVALGAAVEALACYGAMLKEEPDPDTHSRLLMTLQYCDTVDEDLILAETQRWVRTYAAQIAPMHAWPNVRFEPEKPLSIAVVSRDFRLCSTLFLARPLLENLPEDWTVAFYANVEHPDSWTDFFRGLCDRWVDIFGADDETVANHIAAEGIGVLIDMNGHTLGGRPRLFARKPAPVQLTWLDYVGTTGLDTMDAIVADDGHVPFADQPRYSEPIHHVRDDLYRYAPPPNAPAVAELPAARNGFITFGCFNSAYKLSMTTVKLWGEVLRAAPTARLLLNAPEFRHPDTCARFRDLFGAQGVAEGRLAFRPGAPDPMGMLAAYSDVDIALDPMPYSGGLTTLEGLYMGVPAITAPGRRFGSRHSAVHLRALGLDDWIATDAASYVGLACAKAGDIAALARLRAGLRARMMTSPLVDGPAFAADFTAIVRKLWRAVCARQESC